MMFFFGVACIVGAGQHGMTDGNIMRENQKLYKSFKKKEIYEFNYDGSYNFWRQIERNYEKKN